MRDLSKQLFAIAFYCAVILGVVYFVAFRAKEIGWRAVLPYFFSDISSYGARLGGFNLLDTAKIFTFALAIYFAFVNCANTVSLKLFPPSPIATRMDKAITKLAKLEENDVRCYQIAPDVISIRHSARATLSPEWWRKSEGDLEIPVGIAFRRIDIRRSRSEVLIHFDYADGHKTSDILVEKDDGSFQVIRGNGGKYVYVIGDAKNIDECETVKIGYVERFSNIEKRISEAIRWKSPVRNLITFMPVNGESDETAIHHQFADFQILEDENGDEVGDELFTCAPPVVAWVKEKINQQG